jgi:hypothetical protein
MTTVVEDPRHLEDEGSAVGVGKYFGAHPLKVLSERHHLAGDLARGEMVLHPSELKQVA